MGTRHITAVFHDGKYKISQYGQWDGYPSGQGKTILEFLKDFDRTGFIKQLEKTFVPTGEQVEAWYREAGHTGGDMVSFQVGQKFAAVHPTLSRDTGAEVLAIVRDAVEPVPLRINDTFFGESLFCEWAYVIDLDKHTLEVFKGFNKNPLTEADRFFSLQKADEEYKPVRLVKSYPLYDLPTVQRLVRECEIELND